MGKQLADFEVLSFDCYGTLIDWETGIWDALQPLFQRNGGAMIGRSLALGRFAEQESRVERENASLPYPQVLARVHAGIAAESGLLSDAELDQEFGRSVGGWPAFADTAEALRFLQTRYRLVILSNVDRVSFAASNRKLGVRFDAVYTAQDIGSYKPCVANFHYLVEQVREQFGLGPEAILHTAQSLYHDHVPARACGLATAWIDRQGLSQGGAWGATSAVGERPEVDFLFHSMAGLAAAVKAGAE
jgi:2-haloalkanoic acid dehalogenase type II